MSEGVRLPTGGDWVTIPGSPFQVMTNDYEDWGVVHLRFDGTLLDEIITDAIDRRFSLGDYEPV